MHPIGATHTPTAGQPELDVVYVGTLPPHPGGSAISGFQIIAGLARNGIRVRAVGPVTTDSCERAQELALYRPEIEFHRFEVPYYETAPDRPPSEAYRSQEGAAVRPIVSRLIGEARPDVILLGRETFAWHLPDDVTSTRIPCVLRVAGGLLAGLMQGFQPGEFAERLRMMDLVILPGSHLVDVVRRFGCQRVDVIPNSVDLERFCPGPKDPELLRRLEIDPSHLVIAHISNLKHVKRPLDFITAARALLMERSETTFIVIGDGPMRPHLERACHELGIRQHFRFPGWVDYARMPDHIRATDVVVMCSEMEGMARVYLEAQACARVLIASDIPAAREVIAHADNGLLFSLGDANALAAAILQVANDPHRRDEMGARARERMALHSTHVEAHAYAEALCTVADGQIKQTLECPRGPRHEPQGCM